MALIKPIALNMDAFDATNQQTFYFTVNGGTQVVKNRLTIRNNLTNEVIYQNTIETFKFNQIVPSNTLENNVYYNFYFNTFDVNGNMSEDSNIIQFYCYNVPTLIFDNIVNGQEIESSSYNFSVTYNSVDFELLNYLEFIIYNEKDEEISRSSKYYGEVIMPQTFEYEFNGFDISSYSIIVKGVTVNGTNISSDKIFFTVRYYHPTVYSLLDLKQKCDDGYIQILSNVVIPNHEQNPNNLRYIKNLDVLNPEDYIQWEQNYDNVDNIISVWITPYMLDIYNYNEFVKWYDGFKIPNKFKLGIWGKPSKFGEICSIYNKDNINNKIVISLKRNIPYGETVQKDYYELFGYENGELKVYKRSNYVDIMNNNSYYLLMFKKNGNNYKLNLTVIKTKEQHIEWGKSNIEYGKITSDIYWENEENEKEETEPIYLNENIDYIFMLDTFEIKNGVYNNLDITKNINDEYSTLIFPKWDYNTIINCDFNGNINAGNIDIAMSQLSYIKIKRRKKGSSNWITLYKIPIETEEDLNIILKDSFVKSGIEYDYAFVPILSDGTEGNYVTNTIKAILHGTFISNQDKIFKLYSGTVLSTVKNQIVGSLQPINKKYPILIKNGNADFISGTIGGNILGYKFEETKTIDRNDVVKQANDLENFLTDGDSKILSDQNGNCWLVRFNGTPTNNYNQSYGNGIITISDSWIEQGDANSQESLFENGLLKDIE